MRNELPKTLFKYRSVDARSLKSIVENRIYFSDPSTFNDPLDVSPSIEHDLGSIEELESLLIEFEKRRTRAKLTAAAKILSYRGQSTRAKIESRGDDDARKLVDSIRNVFCDSSENCEKMYEERIISYLENRLLTTYERGIFCLAQDPCCPLMWSHYGDQHRGVCLGYGMPSGVSCKIQPVDYDNTRLVKASKIKRMLEGDASSQSEVDAAVLLRKANPWNYEKEWRLIGERGEAGCPLDLEEIIFGFRCEPSAKYAFALAAEGRIPEVKLFEIRNERGTFDLKKYDYDPKDHNFPYSTLTPEKFISTFWKQENS